MLSGKTFPTIWGFAGTEANKKIESEEKKKVVLFMFMGSLANLRFTVATHNQIGLGAADRNMYLLT